MQLTDEVNDMFWSPDELSMYAVTGSGKLKIFDYPNFSLKSAVTGHSSACVQIKLSSDKQSFFVASFDSLISHWDVKSGHCFSVISK